MSETDSFIQEVTEEVRRDRLFALFRRYGWIAILAVLLIVGGAAWNEYRKSENRAEAQATGDALLEALDRDDAAARAEALGAFDAPSEEAQIVVDLLAAGEALEAGRAEAATETLGAVASTSGEAPEIYREIAAFKAVLAAGTRLPPEERRVRMEALASSGGPLALLAEEQLALVDVEEGRTEAALTRLQGIVDAANVSPGLRRRASQLIVALGGELGSGTGQ
ncbi:tetratricopeptide repeat protein [Salinihabitans flavidus]|uniref:tetratricopeptide repeat protein n=1 Tax=Salinihabitans flavidus TaxID=569882 RepID=UPI000B87950F|nr:tetratricopeptide repeat protein [Salinihabitans flavidus]